MGLRAGALAVLLSGCSEPQEVRQETSQDAVTAVVQDLVRTRDFQPTSCDRLDHKDEPVTQEVLSAEGRIVKCVGLNSRRRGVEEAEYVLWSEGSERAGFVSHVRKQGSMDLITHNEEVSPFELLRFAVAKDLDCATGGRLSIQKVDCDDTIGL